MVSKHYSTDGSTHPFVVFLVVLLFMTCIVLVLFDFVLFEKGSCYVAQALNSHYVVWAGLELMILLSQLPKC